jgi:hypothetical protein
MPVIPEHGRVRQEFVVNLGHILTLKKKKKQNKKLAEMLLAVFTKSLNLQVNIS